MHNTDKIRNPGIVSQCSGTVQHFRQSKNDHFNTLIFPILTEHNMRISRQNVLNTSSLISNDIQVFTSMYCISLIPRLTRYISSLRTNIVHRCQWLYNDETSIYTRVLNMIETKNRIILETKIDYLIDYRLHPASLKQCTL